MATAIKLELLNTGKTTKKTKAGLEQATYSCKLKGFVGSVEAVLTLKSGELIELNAIVPQAVDKVVVVEIRNVNEVVKG